MNPTDLVDQLSLRDDVPEFREGDTVRVHVRVVEGNRERVQVFEGLVIGKSGGGVRETFRVRKLSFGVGVERTFPVHSPIIAKIERREPRRRPSGEAVLHARSRGKAASKVKEKRDRYVGAPRRPASRPLSYPLRTRGGMGHHNITLGRDARRGSPRTIGRGGYNVLAQNWRAVGARGRSISCSPTTASSSSARCKTRTTRPLRPRRPRRSTGASSGGSARSPCSSSPRTTCGPGLVRFDVGAMMGSGGLVVMDEDTCMVDIAKFFMDFIQRESCGKCIPCREGTRRMLEILQRITRGRRREKGHRRPRTLRERAAPPATGREHPRHEPLRLGPDRAESRC